MARPSRWGPRRKERADGLEEGEAELRDRLSTKGIPGRWLEERVSVYDAIKPRAGESACMFVYAYESVVWSRDMFGVIGDLASKVCRPSLSNQSEVCGPILNVSEVCGPDQSEVCGPILNVSELRSAGLISLRSAGLS